MDNLKENVNFSGRISLGEKIAYGFGDVGSNLVWATITSFMAFFYTDIVGIGAATVGTIFFVSRLLDGLTDLGMGIVIDRTTTRWGKARPWLLWIAIPYGAAAVLLFSAPDFSMTGKIIYAVITYNLMTTICYTIYNMPYGTLTSLMTQNQYDRSILNIFRMVGGVSAALIINNIAMPIVNSFGGGAHGWQMTFVLFGTLAAIIILCTFFFTKERVKPVSEKKVPIKEGLKGIAQNKYWKMVLILGCLTFILMGMPGVNIYYAQYILGNPVYIGPIMTSTFLPALIGMLLMAPLVKKIGKRNTVFIGFGFFVIGSLVMILNPYNPTYIIAGTFIKQFGFAPLIGSIFAFVVDTIEYGEWKTGVRTEGLVYSAASLGQKIGTALALAMIGWVMGLGGYVGGVAEQTASALASIKFLFLYVSLIVYFLIAILMIFYKLDKEYPQIVEDLRQRKLQHLE